MKKLFNLMINVYLLMSLIEFIMSQIKGVGFSIENVLMYSVIVHVVGFVLVTMNAVNNSTVKEDSKPEEKQKKIKSGK